MIPNSLHFSPQRGDKFFARMTEFLIQLLATAKPATRQLYEYLRCRVAPDVPYELFLEEFQEWSEVARGKGYSLKWCKRIFQQLVELGLVEVIREYSSKVFKIRVVDPSYPSQKSGTKVPSGSRSSKKIASNPHGCDSLLRDQKRTTTEPPTHPVVDVLESRTADLPGKEVEGLDPTPKNALQEQEILGEDKSFARAALEALGVNFNGHVVKLLRNHTPSQIRQAIAVVEQNQQKRNPTGLFVQALKQAWEPPPEERHPLQDKVFVAAPPSEEPTTQEQASNLKQLSQIVRSKVKRAGNSMRKFASLIGSSQQEPPICNNPTTTAPSPGLESIGSRLNPYPSSG